MDVDLISRRSARLANKPSDRKPKIQAKVMIKKWGNRCVVRARPADGCSSRPPSAKLCATYSLIAPGMAGERMCRGNCAPRTSPYYLVSISTHILVWNVRSLNSRGRRSIVKELIREGVSVVCLQETTAGLL
jgi:hypothetical protein